MIQLLTRKNFNRYRIRDPLFEINATTLGNDQVKWDKSGKQLHNFIRGLDSSPAAWTSVTLENPKETENVSWQEVRLYGAQLYKDPNVPSGRPVYFEGYEKEGIQWDNGILIPGQDGQWVCQ